MKTYVDTDNRDQSEMILYLQDRIEAQQRYIKALEDRLRAYEQEAWRENERLVGRQR